MELVLAVLTGGLVAGGVYLMLRRNLERLLFGLVLISNAVNLLIFTSGGLTRGRPALLPVAPDVAQGATANPLPQALILTAIVIGFGLLTCALLAYLVPRSWIGVAGAAALLAAGTLLLVAVTRHGVLVAQIGGWPAPFGISLVADHLSAFMVALAGLLGVSVTAYALVDVDRQHRRLGFDPLLQILLAGAVKFVTLNLIATILLLAAIGLLYGVTGSLNMADLHQRVQAHAQPALLSAIAIAFLVAIGVKAAIFPLFFSHDVGYTHALMLVVAALTMVTGGLGAIAQHEFRRILAFHSISQIGYMVLGLALFTPLALAGAILFMAHHSVVKANLFLVSGIAARLGGSFELDRLGGPYPGRPPLPLSFL